MMKRLIRGCAAALAVSSLLVSAPALCESETEILLEESYKEGYLVTAKQANMRKLPDKRSNMLDQLRGGTLVEVLDATDDGWAYVRDTKTGRKGYIMVSLLEPVPSPTPTPTPTPVPTPTPTPTPTPPPSPTPEPTPVLTLYEEENIGRPTKPTNLRKTPDGQRLESCGSEERLTIKGEIDYYGETWLFVETEDGREGYMLASLIRLIRPADLVPLNEELVLLDYPVLSCDPIADIKKIQPFFYTPEELARYFTLREGDRCDEVLDIKIRLYELGYFRKRNDNENFTASTAEVIEKFQDDHGLPVTGEADPHTQAMLFDERTLPREGSQMEIKYLSNKDMPLWIQRAETSSYGYCGSVQLSARNDTGAKLTGFGLKIIPYMSDGTPAYLADTFAEEIEREYSITGIAIADGRSYSDFYVPEEDEDYEEPVYNEDIADDWLEIFGPDYIGPGGGQKGPHHFKVSPEIYFSGAQIAISWYRSGGVNVYVDDDQMAFFSVENGAGGDFINTLPIEITDEERAAAKWEMGVVTRYVLPVYQKYYNLPQGAWIKTVSANSPAEDAGLMEGDIIVGVGDITILGDRTLRKARASIAPGDSEKLVFWRDGQYYQTEIIRPGADSESNE